MYEESKDQPQSLRTALLHQILENGIRIDKLDEDYFI